MMTNEKRLTDQELKEELRTYEGVLNNRVIDYGIRLINLDSSVFQGEFSKDEMEKLMQLDVYKKIAKFNICRKAVKIFADGNFSLSCTDNNNGVIVQDSYDLGDEFDVFRCSDIDNNIVVNLFEFHNSVEQRKKEIDVVFETLERLNAEKCSFGLYASDSYTQASGWPIEHARDIKATQKALEELNSRDQMSKAQQYEAKVKQYFCDEFIKSCDINFDIGVEVVENNNFIMGRNRNNMARTLVKKYPGISVFKNIKYY